MIVKISPTVAADITPNNIGIINGILYSFNPNRFIKIHGIKNREKNTAFEKTVNGKYRNGGYPNSGAMGKSGSKIHIKIITVQSAPPNNSRRPII